MDRHQTTVRSRSRFVGTGLHSAKTVTVDVVPAPAGTGIVFQRTDLGKVPPVPATPHAVSATALSTTIGNAPNSVATVEHLMAAFAGVGVDNAIVRIDGPEVPIMDGSAAPFVDKLLAAGLTTLAAYRRLLLIKKPFELKDGQRLMRIEPALRQRFCCDVDYTSAAIGRQSLDFTFSRSAFLELCEARTFCHVSEVEAMRARGLALGGSLDNAVVVDDRAVLNAEGLRRPDEPVRHKVLDCIGDLWLLGAPLIGRITLSRNGHGLHAAFMRELLARKAELLTVVEVGAFRERRHAAGDLQAVAAAAAIYG